MISERRIGDVTLLDLQGRLVLDDGDEEVRTHVNHLVSEARLKALMNLKVVADPLHPENILEPSGRGIFLINGLMDDVRFADGGREVRMRKKKGTP